MTQKKRNPIVLVLQKATSIVAAVVSTIAIFLVLPMMQTISSPPGADTLIRDIAIVEPPPPEQPEIEEEPEQEEPPEPPPPTLNEAPPLDLSQLELALSDTVGDNSFGGFAPGLAEQLGGQQAGEDLDKIFSLADLDQRPRVIFQRLPQYPAELRKAGRQGTVYVVFSVDTKGRVSDPKVQRSTDPAFERPALDAVRQWRFEPGTRNGEKVSFRMRIPISFNAG